MHLTIVLRAAVYEKCASVEEEGKRKVKKEVLDETVAFEAVKEMLVRNKRDIEWIRCMNVGSYLDIKAFYPIIRIKVKRAKEICVNRKNGRRCNRYLYELNI